MLPLGALVMSLGAMLCAQSFVREPGQSAHARPLHPLRACGDDESFGVHLQARRAARAAVGHADVYNREVLPASLLLLAAQMGHYSV